MKTWLLVVLGGLLSVSVSAADLVISVERNLAFKLWVNEVAQNAVKSRRLKVSNIPGPLCSIQIRFRDESQRPVELVQNLFVQDNFSYQFEVRKRPGGGYYVQYLEEMPLSSVRWYKEQSSYTTISYEDLLSDTTGTYNLVPPYAIDTSKIDRPTPRVQGFGWDKEVQIPAPNAHLLAHRCPNLWRGVGQSGCGKLRVAAHQPHQTSRHDVLPFVRPTQTIVRPLLV